MDIEASQIKQFSVQSNVFLSTFGYIPTIILPINCINPTIKYPTIKYIIPATKALTRNQIVVT